jgi:hypothetical protein
MRGAIGLVPFPKRFGFLPGILLCLVVFGGHKSGAVNRVQLSILSAGHRPGVLNFVGTHGYLLKFETICRVFYSQLLDED